MTNNLATAYAVPDTEADARALAKTLRAQLPEAVALRTVGGNAVVAHRYDDSADLFIDGAMSSGTGRAYKVSATLGRVKVQVTARTNGKTGRMASERVQSELRDELANCWIVPETRRLRHLLAAAHAVRQLGGMLAAGDPLLDHPWYDYQREYQREQLRHNLCALVQFELPESSSERLAAEALAGGWTGTPAELLIAARAVGAPASRAAT